MSIFQNLKGTTQNLFRIGKNKWNIDASAATALRQLKLGNAEIDFTGPTLNQFLKYDGTKWLPAAGGGGGGSGYTEIAAAGNITGTYDGNVMCLGDVTLTGNLVVKGNLFVVGNLIKPDSAPTYNIEVRGNTTILGYFDYQSTDMLTPTFNFYGDLTVIGEVLHQETFSPTSVGYKYLVNSPYEFSINQAGFSDLTVQNIIDADNFDVAGDVTADITSGQHITYLGIPYFVVNVSFNGVDTEFNVIGHPFVGGETFRTRSREFLKLSGDFANNGFIQNGDILYFSSNDFATISNVFYDGADTVIELNSPNFVGNNDISTFGLCYLDRLNIFYISSELLHNTTNFRVETGAAAGELNTNILNVAYDSNILISQIRVGTPLSILFNFGTDEIAFDVFNSFRTNKYLLYNDQSGGDFSFVETLPWFQTKRIRLTTSSEVNFADTSPTAWNLDETDQTRFNQRLSFGTSWLNPVLTTDIFAVEIPSSIVIKSTAFFNFYVKGNLKLVNCFWTKTGDENTGNKQQGMQLVVDGDIICRNDIQNTSQDYWNNIPNGPFIQASGTDNYNFAINASGPGGEIICGGDIKGIGVYACGGLQVSGGAFATPSTAGAGGKIICKNFVGSQRFDLNNGQPIPSNLSALNSGIWLNGGYIFMGENTVGNISAIAGGTNPAPVSIAGDVIAGIFSVNGGSYPAETQGFGNGFVAVGGDANPVSINGNLSAFYISWCGGRGNTTDIGVSVLSGNNGAVSQFYVGQSVNTYIFWASAGVSRSEIGGFGGTLLSRSARHLGQAGTVNIDGDFISDTESQGGFIGDGDNYQLNFNAAAVSSPGTFLNVGGNFIGRQIRTRGGNLTGSGTSICTSGQGGSVNIYGNATITNGVRTSAGYVDKVATSVGTSGSFFCRGNVNAENSGIFTSSPNSVTTGTTALPGNAGAITIQGKLYGTAQAIGGISTGTASGGNGGAINVTNIESNLSGSSSISSAGGASTSSTGGNGGQILVEVIRAPLLAVTSAGGNGVTGGSPGAITAVDWVCASISATSGNATSGNSPNGGAITFQSNGYIGCTGLVSSKAGNVTGGSISTTGVGGNITLPTGRVGSISTEGGNNTNTTGAQSGNCGRAGSLSITGNLLVGGNILCTGGSHSTTGAAALAGAGPASFVVNGDLTVEGSINASGGSRSASSTTGTGAVGGTLVFNGPVNCSGSILSNGGLTTAASTAGKGGDMAFNLGVTAFSVQGRDSVGSVAITAALTVEFNGVCRIGGLAFTNRTGVKFRSNISGTRPNATLITAFGPSVKNQVANSSNVDQASTFAGGDTYILNFGGVSWYTFGFGAVA